MKIHYGVPEEYQIVGKRFGAYILVEKLKRENWHKRRDDVFFQVSVTSPLKLELAEYIFMCP